MRKVSLMLVVFCVGVCSVVSRAQPASPAETAFRDSLVNNRFVLRNFSGEPKVHAVWTENALTWDSPRWHEMAVLEVKDVKVDDQQVTIDCIRQFLLRDKTQKPGLYGSEPAQVIIGLPGGDRDSILAKLKDALFFPSVEDAMAAIPKPFHGSFPVSKSTRRAKTPVKPICDCAAKGTAACVDHSADGGMTPPRALHVIDPEFTEEAKRAGVSGNVETAVSLDSSGYVADVWVSRPLLPRGFGLDEAAALSVEQYVFQPAKCHGKAVPTVLYIDVNFERF